MNIPNELKSEIASHLSFVDLLSLSCTSHTFLFVCRSDSLWKPLTQSQYPLGKLNDLNESWYQLYVRLRKQDITYSKVVSELIQLLYNVPIRFNTSNIKTFEMFSNANIKLNPILNYSTEDIRFELFCKLRKIYDADRYHITSARIGSERKLDDQVVMDNGTRILLRSLIEDRVPLYFPSEEFDLITYQNDNILVTKDYLVDTEEWRAFDLLVRLIRREHDISFIINDQDLNKYPLSSYESLLSSTENKISSIQFNLAIMCDTFCLIGCSNSDTMLHILMPITKVRRIIMELLFNRVTIFSKHHDCDLTVYNGSKIDVFFPEEF